MKLVFPNEKHSPLWILEQHTLLPFSFMDQTMSFLPLFILQVQGLLSLGPRSSGLFSDSFLSNFIFFSTCSDFYMAISNVAFLGHLLSFRLIPATWLTQMVSFPLPICALPTFFSCIGKRHFYTSGWWQEEAQSPVEFPLFLLLSSVCWQTQSTSHCTWICLFCSSSLFPSLSNLSSFHHVVI